MGAGRSSAINVNFNRRSSFYYAGERVTGVISFHNTHKTLKLNTVFLEFIGQFDFTAPDTHNFHEGLVYSNAEYRLVNHRVPFINIRFPVISPKENQNEIILNHGDHSWPFEFTLPESLPPSSHPSTVSYPCVKYYTCIVTNKSWYKRTAKQTYPLTIFPNINLFHVQEGRQSVSLTRRNRQHLQLKVYLHHRGVLPGQKISLDIDLENPKRLKLLRIEATLIQHRRIALDHHAENIFQVDLPDLVNFDQTELHQTFDLQVPSENLAPTYNYKTKCGSVTISTGIYYELQLDTKVQGTVHNVSLKIPIIIGTQSSPEQSQFQTHDCTSMPLSYIAALEEIDLPPSYEIAIRNLKLNKLK